MRIITRIIASLVFLLTVLLPAGGAAANPAQTTHFESGFIATNDCNGEAIGVLGKYTIVSKEQQDGTYVYHFNLQGQGVGSQGNEYVLKFNAKERTSDLEYSYYERILLVSKGTAPNIWLAMHYVDGELTLEPDCRG